MLSLFIRNVKVPRTSILIKLSFTPTSCICLYQCHAWSLSSMCGRISTIYAMGLWIMDAYFKSRHHSWFKLPQSWLYLHQQCISVCWIFGTLFFPIHISPLKISFVHILQPFYSVTSNYLCSYRDDVIFPWMYTLFFLFRSLNMIVIFQWVLVGVGNHDKVGVRIRVKLLDEVWIQT